ncbi:MAG: recN [Clostridiaceae bacterium]|jgi:DNA repair protein RecN (Recombination protein N)|nr:recN [Clostridiaceae bacterium]
MLLQLNIKNFALIENLSISFEKGLNILTGETGAGKSILIDAINFVLGSKFNKDLIRTGESKTFVEAIFSIENPKTYEMLKQFDIEYDDVVIISRETFQSGKSIAKINGKAILLSNLKEISISLLDIHGQHENQNLLDASNHINYLDNYGGRDLEQQILKYKERYDELKEINSKIESLSGNEGHREKLTDFLKYQIKEIEDAKLKIGEDNELEEKYKLLYNSEKISQVLSSAYETLYNGNENMTSIFDRLGIVIRDLKNISENLNSIEDIAKSLDDAYYIIEEKTEEIRNIRENVYYDENEMEYINSRIFAISTLKRKYGGSIEEILEYKNKILEQYTQLNNSSEIIQQLENKRKIILNELKDIGTHIHELREKVSNKLEKNIKEELNQIGLEKSIIKISVELEKQINPNGLDKVQFLISTNPGEPLKPLEKIVSGGELSRIMLALKTVFADRDKIPSIIFDEVDTGISGRIAQSVAEKMFIISVSHQVFCVTHLPQIACMSDVHYIVQKYVLNGKTFTEVKKINENEKKLEIARMIGSSEVTKITLEHADELIKMADEKKTFLNKKVV